MPKRYRQMRVKDLPKINPYMAARVGFKLATLQMQGTELITTPHPTNYHFLYFTFVTIFIIITIFIVITIFFTFVPSFLLSLYQMGFYFTFFTASACSRMQICLR